MNIESIWMIVISVSAPLAGVVAFYLQLQNVRKTNLENQKLTHEVQKLKEENRNLHSRIKMPTDDEVKKYGNTIMFSRCSSSSEAARSLIKRFLGIDWLSLLAAFLIVGFIAYFFYDVFRVGMWLINQF